MNHHRTHRSLAVFPLLVVAGLLLALAGCGGEDDTTYPPVKYDKGQKLDKGYTWPEGGTVNDLWVPPKQDTGVAKKDTGTTKKDVGVTDGSTPKDGSTTTPDGSSTCPPPTGAKCSPACSTGKLCTPAKGGLCAKVVKMTGPASLKAAMAPLAEALGACWKQSPTPKADTLCATLDMCNVTGNLTEKMLSNWLCNTATASDFSSSKAFDNAKDVMGCGLLNLDETDWKLTSGVTGGTQGKICLSYNVVSWGLDDVELNLCTAFPPK